MPIELSQFQPNVSESAGMCDVLFETAICLPPIPELAAHDAAVLVHDPPYVITSPNMRSVPLYYFDAQSLRARADGRFGLEDCWQHPQVWTEKFSFASAIMRKPVGIELEKHQFRHLWWNPCPADYVLLKGSAFADFGQLSQQCAEPLQEIQQKVSERMWRMGEQIHIPTALRCFEASMRSTCTRLYDCPMTFRDVVGQVAEFQRLCLDLLGMMDYLEIFNPRSVDEFSKHPADYTRIGCFTSNPEVVHRLFLAGLPVWFIRFDHALSPIIKIKSVTAYTPPSSEIVVDDWCDAAGTHHPFPTLHHGTSGIDRHYASRQLGRAFADIPNLDMPAIDSSSGKAPKYITTSLPARPGPCKFPIQIFLVLSLSNTVRPNAGSHEEE